ncbi:DUF1579 family protein [Pseudoduganella sp. SL102]|uniref:DUF1579 family protein n=1 Tax=Pseudoduganella sp. SL102 TaxID=2995154 RepID=UPI00248CF2E9|nr:DUF1579 family protein [Pseudoduganella sp. SL102]WBS04547.1 DUF1579 family protein [Pseudoduganella sp. SL102]
MRHQHVLRALLVMASIHVPVLARAGQVPERPAPTPFEQAVTAKMKQASMPGPGHRKLEPLAGKFSVSLKMWTEPSRVPPQAPAPEPELGTSERQWVLDKRFLEETYHGTYAGEPFDGKATMGYDNVTNKYAATWIDTSTSSLSTSQGALKGNVLTLRGMTSDAMEAKAVPYIMKFIIADNDHHTMEWWAPGPKGKYVKCMEMQYTRIK